jgi:DNA-binding IclR family transcriptional regulator
MAVFEHLSTTSGATLSELAADTDQSPATTYRILVTLEARDLVEFDPGPQLWHIGPRAFLIGARYLRRTSLVERARPVLRRLMERTGETANLGIARDGHVLFVSQVETHASIRAFFPPGTLSPMHASGIGKALLAQMSPELRAQAPCQGGAGAVHGPHADRSGGDRGGHGPDPAARLRHRRRGEDRGHALHRGAGPRSARGGGGRASPSRVRRAVSAKPRSPGWPMP